MTEARPAEITFPFLLRLALFESYTYPHKIPPFEVPAIEAAIRAEVELVEPYLNAICDEIKRRITDRLFNGHE